MTALAEVTAAHASYPCFMHMMLKLVMLISRYLFNINAQIAAAAEGRLVCVYALFACAGHLGRPSQSFYYACSGAEWS